MGIFSNLFGEKKPADSAKNNVVSIPGENPFTSVGIRQAGTFLFKCPTSSKTLSTSLQQIYPIIGVKVSCQACKNI
jgi:hypothetical protein